MAGTRPLMLAALLFLVLDTARTSWLRPHVAAAAAVVTPFPADPASRCHSRPSRMPPTPPPLVFSTRRAAHLVRLDGH